MSGSLVCPACFDYLIKFGFSFRFNIRLRRLFIRVIFLFEIIS